MWYRGSTQKRANQLGLAGWVRNCPDGSVELEAEGPRPAVEALVTWCHEGPPAARVSAVEVAEIDCESGPGGFEILR